MNKIPALCLAGLLPIQANALPNVHSHELPGDFIATCAAYGANSAPSTTEITWQSDARRLTISGNNIAGDENLLPTDDDVSHTVHYVTTFHHNETGDIKVLHMTFRHYHKPVTGVYHGKPWQTIRSLRFEIREDATGYIQTYEAADIEGILTVNSYTYLGECQYVGSYVETGSS